MEQERHPVSPIPEFLGPYPVDLIKEAGVWELETAARNLDGGFPDSSRWLETLVSAFDTSFTWAEFEDAEIGLATPSGVPEWNSQRGSIDEWLRRINPQEAPCGGFTASLALKMFWQSPEGEIGMSVFPQSARLLIEPKPLLNPSADAVVKCLFKIGVRLYCDQRWSDAVKAEVNMPSAAAFNRSRLEESLEKWEALTSGTITHWESPRVRGIVKYGFAETCSARS